MAEQNIQILIVEDDPHINDLLRIILGHIPNVDMSTCFRGDEAAELATKTHPDLVILDLMLPGRSGETLVPLFQQKGCDVVVITAKGDVQTLVNVLELGASDYISKPFRAEEVIARVKRLIEQRRPGLEQSLEYRGIRIIPKTRKAYYLDQELPLTQKEFGILELFLKDPERVFTKSQVYELVWGQDFLCDNTISVHLSHLRAKLAQAGCPNCFKVVWGLGWRLFDQSSDANEQ